MICELYMTVTLCYTSYADNRIETAFNTTQIETIDPNMIYDPLNRVNIPKPQFKQVVYNVQETRQTKKQRREPAAETRILAYANPEVKLVERKSWLGNIFATNGTNGTKVKVPNNLSPGYAAVYAASVKHGVDPNFMLKVAKQENGGRCKRDSSAGAKGVLQVMPGTARQHGVYKASKLNDCKIGADVGVREMKKLLAMTNGNKAQALVGYNCGPGCIGRKRLPRETKHYVKAILGKDLK